MRFPGLLLTAALAVAVAGSPLVVEAGSQSGVRYAQVSVSIGLGSDDACALTTTGRIVCLQGAITIFPTPKGGDFTQMSINSGGGCALRWDEFIACWPSGYGKPPKGRFSQVSVGPTSACAIRPDGRLTCWDGFPALTPPPGKFVQVSLGGGTIGGKTGWYDTMYDCGVERGGTVKCWGGQEYGPPENVYSPRGKFLQVSADIYGACGLRVDHTITCWKALGPPWPGDVRRIGPSSYRYTEVSGGCGLRRNHLVYCEGQGSIPPQPQRYKQIAMGDSTFCGVLLDGTLYPPECGR